VTMGFQYFSIDYFRHEACPIRFLRSILRPCPPSPSRLSVVRTQRALSYAPGDRTGSRLRVASRSCADRFEWNCHRLHRRKVISLRCPEKSDCTRVAPPAVRDPLPSPATVGYRPSQCCGPAAHFAFCNDLIISGSRLRLMAIASGVCPILFLMQGSTPR
jgi:hypothetical protein